MGADLVGPGGVLVVDGEVGAVGLDTGDLVGAAGEADDGGAGVLGVLDEEGADAAGGGGDHGESAWAPSGSVSYSRRCMCQGSFTCLGEGQESFRRP